MSNPITVELPADLPTDWQQYQVVSPNGTEAGLDEQHGYNYLMEQVNNAQTAAKECGEALGDTVPASREINGHPLTDDVDLDAADVGAATVSQINSAVSNYLPLSGGTMSGTAQVRRVAYAGQWYQGRDRALIRTTSAIQNQYVPIISVKSGEGSWEIGTYQDDRLYFTYITDEAYESNDNTTNQGNEGGSRNVYLDVNGNFSGKAAGLTNTLPVANGGTGKTSVGGTDYTTVRFRGSGLRNADTNPTDNGTINWTYG